VTTTRATSVVVTATLEVVVAAAVAAAEAHITTPAEELVAAAITEVEATRTAMSPAVHVTTTMLAIGLTRSIKKRPLKQATSTASLRTPQDFTTYFFLRNSNLSGFPSTTRRKTHFSGSDAMP
jgi:nitrate reductase gamma subunit